MKAAFGVLAFLVAGCQEHVAAQRVSVFNGKVEELWSGGGLCARTAEGLFCAHLDDKAPTGPAKRIEGIGKVKDVAMSLSRVCVLDEAGVACADYLDAKAMRLPLEAPTQVIVHQDQQCIVHASGVSCFVGYEKSPPLVPELGKPQRLVSDEGESMLCGVYAEDVRCARFDREGKQTGGGAVLLGVKDPKMIQLNTMGGTAYVYDGDRLLFGTFEGTLTVANPFGNAPLGSGVAIRPFTGAKVQLAPLNEVGHVRAAVRWSPGLLVLDEKGVSNIEWWARKQELHAWPTKTAPTALQRGFSQEFLTIENNKVHLHGQASGKKYDREVTGLGKPVRVFSGVWWTCILDDAGAVSCTPSPKS